MKKLLSFILALVMVLSLSVTVFAGTVDQDSSPKTSDTAVEFSIDPTYTITIPATVTLGKNTAQDGTVTYEKDLTITANDVRLNQNSTIGISMDSDFKMDVTNASATNLYQLAYQAFVGSTEITATNKSVAVFITDTSEQSVVIHFTAGNPEYAGYYSDTVTFTIANL